MKLEEYLKEHQKEYLIFDFDNTIVHLILPWSKLMNQLKVIEKNVDKKFTSKIRVLNDLSKISNMLVKRYGPGSWIIIAKLWIEFEKRNLKGYNLNLETIKFIKENKNKYKFYIWTSNTTPTVERILKELEIFEIFDKLITREEVQYLKPNPAGFLKIYKESENKSKYLMIGDSNLNDGEAARSSGIDFIKT